MHPPPVTVIIPTFNRAELLGRALRSVAGQTHRPIEVIVADDGSTDGTPRRIPAYREQLSASGIDLHYAWQPNQGPAAARNRALKTARGQFVCFLDSDDTWRPTFLATLLELFATYPTAALAFCSSVTVDDCGRVVAHRDDGMDPDPAEGILRRPEARITRHMPLVTPAVMLRCEVAQKLNGFDESFRIGEDWDLWYRVARDHDFAYTREPLACCLQHDGNHRHSSAAALAEKVRLNLKHVARVRDSAARSILLRRMTKYSILLQEQLLREGLCDRNGLVDLLTHPLLPRTWRFKIAAALQNRPRWIGLTYAALVRAAGHTRRAAAIV